MQKTFYYSGFGHRTADFVSVSFAMVLPVFCMPIYFVTVFGTQNQKFLSSV